LIWALEIRDALISVVVENMGERPDPAANHRRLNAAVAESHAAKT
jgi:hypothetical protein